MRATLSASRVAANGVRRQRRSNASIRARFATIVSEDDAQKSASSDASKELDFGFRKVDESDKKGLVRGVFESVASNYDIMNDLMSGTLHRYWKNEFVKMASPVTGENHETRILDLASGTGDIAFRLIDRGASDMAFQPGSSLKVVMTDINSEMLKQGKLRAEKRRNTADYVESFSELDAEQMDGIASDSFDLVTIAFGIRNVNDVDAVLREAHRVLKPGGRFMCLEFSHVSLPVLAAAYDAYSFNVIPKLGELVAGDRESYQYLVESIRKFPKQREFVKKIADAGFSYASHVDMTAGVVAVHQGLKPLIVSK